MAGVSYRGRTWLVEILRRSARSQGAKTAPVVVLPVAVSDQVGVAEFVRGARRSAKSFGGGLAEVRKQAAREKPSWR